MIDVRQAILETLPKDLLLDLEDRLAAEALRSFEVVRDHCGLNAKRSREMVGQFRFRAQEQGFEELVQNYGGVLLGEGIMLGTDLKIFQPFARFAGPTVGVILGFASMPEPRSLPPKNRSRSAGVTANYHLQPRLDLDGTGSKADDIFVSFLVARDRERAGMIEEVAVGVICSAYEKYLFYSSLDAFLSGYGAAPVTPLGPFPDGSGTSGAVVKLRPKRSPYVPPEKQRPYHDAGDGTAD